MIDAECRLLRKTVELTHARRALRVATFFFKWKCDATIRAARVTYEMTLVNQDEKRVELLRDVRDYVRDTAARQQCCVCFERPRDTLFEACSHLACCTACSRKLDACPVCRTEGATRHVYVA